MKRDGPPMDDDWKAVGRAVEARIRELGVTWETFYTSSGVSEATVSGVRKGRPIKRPDKLRDLTRGLGWSDDSVDRVLRGEPPVLNPRVRAVVDDYGRLLGVAGDLGSSQVSVDISTDAGPIIVKPLFEGPAALADRVTTLEGQVRRLAEALELSLDELMDDASGPPQPAATQADGA